METSADIQLLSSSSVAVSTSQDFDDNATITAFWEKNNTTVRVSGSLHQREIEKKNYSSYFFKSHGTEFVYFECVLQTGNRSSCIDVRPELRRLFEHVWILLVLYRTKNEIKKYSANRIYQQTLFWYIL